MGNNKTTTGTTTKEGAVVEQKITKKFVIVIDPGHGDKTEKGWRDPGTHTKDEKHLECDHVLTLSKAIKESLDTNSDYEVYLTRETDGIVVAKKGPKWKTDFAAEKNADILISMHMDSDSDKGIFTVYQQDKESTEENSKKLGGYINTEIASSSFLTSRTDPLRSAKDATRFTTLGVLNGFSGEAAVLIEFGGINSDIVTNIENESKEIGDIFLKAIDNYYSNRE